MIIQEQFIEFGKTFIRTYSNDNRYVVRDGIEYSEAIDFVDQHREYTEGRVIEDNEEII